MKILDFPERTELKGVVVFLESFVKRLLIVTGFLLFVFLLVEVGTRSYRSGYRAANAVPVTCGSESYRGHRWVQCDNGGMFFLK